MAERIDIHIRFFEFECNEERSAIPHIEYITPQTANSFECNEERSATKRMKLLLPSLMSLNAMKSGVQLQLRGAVQSEARGFECNEKRSATTTAL